MSYPAIPTVPSTGVEDLAGPHDHKKVGRRVLAITLASLCVIAFGIRLYAGQNKPFVNTDEAAYLIAGRNLWRGEGFSLAPNHPHLSHPGAIGVLQVGVSLLLPGRNLDIAGSLVFALAGVLGTAGMFLLGAKLFNDAVGLLASCLYAIVPSLAVQGYYWSSASEPLTVTLLVWGFFFYSKTYLGERLRWAPMGAFVFGIASMFRYDGMVCFVFMSCLLAWRCWWSRAISVRTLLPYLALLLASYSVAYAPYGQFCWRHTGRFTTSIALQNLIHQDPFRELPTQVPGYVPQYDSSLEYVIANWDRIPARVVYHLKVFASTSLRHVLPFYLLLFVGIGSLIWPRNGPSAMTLIFIVVMGLSIAPYCYFSMTPRFALLTLPALLLFVARGLWLINVVGPRTTWFIRLAVLGALVMQSFLHVHRYSAQERGGEFRRAAAWVAENSNRTDVVAARKPFVALLADRYHVGIPLVETNEELSSALLNEGVRFFVFDEAQSLPIRPWHKDLLDREYLAHTASWKLRYAEWEQGHSIVVIEPMRTSADESVNSCRRDIGEEL
jgi:hypothetical protein